MTVSIITPCYNGARFLRETLDSALNQTVPPLEVIVVDDGSTDDSAAIAASFGPPVRVIRQHNQGESVARNRGIGEARGSHILFLDADDLLHHEALERLAAAVEGDPLAVAVMGGAVFFDDPTRPHSLQHVKVNQFFPKIISGNIGIIHAWLTPTELVHKAGGFSNTLVYFEDWDFWCQIALAGGKLVPVDFVGAYYRRHASAQTPSAKKTDRKLGHVAVVEHLIDGLLQQPALLTAHGGAAFWSAWSALRSSRDLGIPWTRLKPLVSRMQVLLRQGPPELQSSRFGRMARVMGFRLAFLLQGVDRSTGASTSDDALLRKVQSLHDTAGTVQ